MMVSLSSDGMIVAIGAPYNDGDNGSDSGHVRIHQYDGTTWTQLGTDIDGEAAYNNSGRSVSLSSNGTIVAIGAKGNNGNSSDIYNDRGHVRIFQWNGTSWPQLGGDINGAAAGDESGKSVSLSSDGMIVAIGAPYNNGDNGSNSGHVRIHQYDGTTWTQLGTDINGAAAGDYSGYSVSLSADADGTIVAIGAPKNDDNDNNSGHVKIYKISSIDCVGDYVNIGVCSTTCGPGTQQQEYKISQSSENGGASCSITQHDTRNISCNITPCPIDCEGSFGDYETCSVGCGGGTQSRTYTITKGAQHGGTDCLYSNGYTEEKECNTGPCPIHCNGDFKTLGECSRECGGGVLRQFYDITTEAQHGGGQCDHKQNDLKTIPCNTQPCPTYAENTTLQEALKESNNKIQNIRYNIIDRQEELDTLTNKFNRLNKNISFLKHNKNYVPDDKTLTFY